MKQVMKQTMKQTMKQAMKQAMKRANERHLTTGAALLLAMCMLAACKDRHEPVKPTVQHNLAAQARF